MAETIETWQSNSVTGNTPTALKKLVPMVTHSFSVSPIQFQIFGDFMLKKHLKRPQTRPNIFICLLDHADQVPLANIEKEGKGSQQSF